jgi:hypothetical protein
MMLPTWRNVFRFRLRTLLLAVTVVSVLLGLHVHSTERQRRSVLAIQQYGGWVRYGFQFPTGKYSSRDFDPKACSIIPQWLLDRLGVDFFHDVVQVSLNYTEDTGKREENHNKSDDALQYLEGFPNLRVLLLDDTQASDASLQHLAKLKNLEYLFMWDVTNVTDAGVARLQGLKNLRYVHLTKSQITDKSLAIFAQLPKIDGLSLQFNNFTDEGLEHIAPLVQLKSLWVCGRKDRPNKITDTSLKHLENLTQLTELGIQNTQVTRSGVASFLRAVPSCKLHCSPLIGEK